jgi:hypothetical protein
MYTAGYREGISESKEKFLQDGFDEGWKVGAEVGICVGELLGKLSGMSNALKILERKRVAAKEPVVMIGVASSSTDTTATSDASTEDASLVLTNLVELIALVESEVSRGRIFMPEYLGSNGVWKFEGGTVKHPMITEWMGKVEEAEVSWRALGRKKD